MIKIWNTKQIFSRMDTTLHPALSICRSVGQSVGWSVGRLVRGHKSKSEETPISAPAHPSATGGRVSGLVFSSSSFFDLSPCLFFLIFD